MNVSVILPTFNEKDNIVPLIQAIHRAIGDDAEVIVVDDNSPDGTWERVQELAATSPTLRLLRRVDKKGLVSALSDGIDQARGDVIVWMDCDFSMPPGKIKDLLDVLRDGFDVAVGSRFVKDGGVEIITGSSDTILSFLMSAALNRFIQTVLTSSFKDYTSGFIAVRRTVLENIPLRGDYGEYFIDLIFKALKRGYKVKEVPYLCTARRQGISKTGTTIFDYFRKGRKYISTTLRLRFSKTP